ncbi:MAG: hypothetical protein F7C07_02220 [Desulfurococcales archaeon]|nr:hypothetical protein [Desulfurococcales archaeon]
MAEHCIRGGFKRFIGARVEYPQVTVRLYLNDEFIGTIDFLVDTGASTTFIAYKDLLVLRIINKLRGKRKVDVIGLGGVEKAVVLRGPIRLELLDTPRVPGEARRPITIELDSIRCEDPDSARKIMRLHGHKALMARPSVLGWDVLNSLKLIINYKERIIELCKDEP